MLDVFDGMAKKHLAEAAELFGGIGGEEFEAGRGSAFFVGPLGSWEKLFEMGGDGARR